MIHALHGNFGLPSDWDAALPPGVPATAWHLWEIRRHHPEARTLTGFAGWFNNKVAALPGQDPRILTGYSLGGRLALHILLDRPALWDRVLLISTHPGLVSEADRTARLRHDTTWQKRCYPPLPPQGDRFSRKEDQPPVDPDRPKVAPPPPGVFETWPTLCAAWNAQPVLQGHGPVSDPLLTGPWREEIAGALKGWSLGFQENCLPALSQLPVSGIWMAGGADRKFSTLALNAVQTATRFDVNLIPDAGHRLLAEQPGAVKSSLQHLLDMGQTPSASRHSAQSPGGMGTPYPS